MKPGFNPWPLGIGLFFALLFCSLATVVVIAVSHRDTLVSENYYETELKFQGQINAVARARQCGASLVCDPARRTAVLTLPAAQVSTNLSGTIKLYRPSSSGLDQTIRLEPKADGIQTVDLSHLAPGRWWVRAGWNVAGLDYYLEQEFSLNGD
jgi:hypothetical protein